MPSLAPLIDKYTLQDAIDDKVTVPIVYEGRVIPQEVTSQQINEHLKHITVGLTEDARKDLEVKYSRFVALAQTEQRLNMIAFDLHEHFVHYVRPKGIQSDADMLISRRGGRAVLQTPGSWRNHAGGSYYTQFCKRRR